MGGRGEGGLGRRREGRGGEGKGGKGETVEKEGKGRQGPGKEEEGRGGRHGVNGPEHEEAVCSKLHLQDVILWGPVEALHALGLPPFTKHPGRALERPRFISYAAVSQSLPKHGLANCQETA